MKEQFVSLIEYFGVRVGGRVEIVDTIEGGNGLKLHKCSVVPMNNEAEPDQRIHYIFQHEITAEPYNVESVIKEGVYFLAGTASISAGRVLAGVIAHCQKNGVPEHMNNNPELAPASLIGELLKVIGDKGIDVNDGLDIVDGKHTREVLRKFVSVWFKLNREMVTHIMKHEDLVGVVGSSLSEDMYRAATNQEGLS
ncbi:hypothetical protein [Vibrio sp. WXL210]|uniref:hypothetical protein n=1 Tax=Vibrio sp. WXL210 TaxID=3450709 RepID=UPI003EC8CC57